MKAEILHMSKLEQARSEVMRLYVDGYIKQKEAGKRMVLSVRQVRRLAKAYRLNGCNALVHGNRAKPSNRKVREETKNQAIALVQQKYPDFGPTFAADKLVENDEITVSTETLLQWMIEAGIWTPKCKRHQHIILLIAHIPKTLFSFSCQTK